MKKHHSTLNIASILLGMLAVFSFSFVSCSDDDEDFRMPDEDEFLTEDVIVEQTPYYTKKLSYELWGQKGTFQEVEAIVYQCNADEGYCVLDIKNAESHGFRKGWVQQFFYSVEKWVAMKTYIGKNIAVSGSYKYVYSEIYCDAPYQGESYWDCYNLDITDVKLVE